VNKDIKSDIDCETSERPSIYPSLDIEQITRRAFEQLFFVAEDIASLGAKDERRAAVRVESREADLSCTPAAVVSASQRAILRNVERGNSKE
jgi:hypothetical protein